MIGQESAFPLEITRKDPLFGSEWKEVELGISKRLYVATEAMKAILGSFKPGRLDKQDREYVAERAYALADTMLTFENHDYDSISDEKQ